MIEIIKYVITIFLLDQLVSTIVKSVHPRWRKRALLTLLVLICAVSYELIVSRLSNNFLETFSINRIFSPDTLKKDFRRLSLTYHPDRIQETEGADENKFQEIRFQYDTLLNEKTRVVYDKFGPEVSYFTRMEGKEIDPVSLLNTYRMGFLMRDGIFYLIFSIVFAAISSEEGLSSCRKICYSIIFGFYAFEAAFLLPDIQSYDIFDYFFPRLTIWQRIHILKGFIGILCITIKGLFKLRIIKPEFYIMEKFQQIKILQEKLNAYTKSSESLDLIKNYSDNSEFRQQLNQLNQLMKETAQLCEENSTETKKTMKKRRKRRIKLSLFAVFLFSWCYNFVNS